MYLPLKDSLTVISHIRRSPRSHSPVRMAKGIEETCILLYTKPQFNTNIIHSHQSFLMTSQRPLPIRPLTPSRRARGSVFFLSAHSTNLVRDNACHQIDDNDPYLLELVGVESVKGWPDGFLESIFVLQCDDAHLRE